MNQPRPFEECPQFDACSAAICPLDPEMPIRQSLPGDPRCKARKRTRLEIASRFPMEFTPPPANADGKLPLVRDWKPGQPFGLLARDVSREKKAEKSRERWESMSEEERAEVLARLRPKKKGDPDGGSKS